MTEVLFSLEVMNLREFYRWRDSVVEQVRFRPDRAAIEEELTAHYEDHVKDLERLGYEQKLAEQRALRAMGDPVEIGRAMDRVHQPWLGWLWLVSKALVVLSIIVVSLYVGSNYITIVQDLNWPEEGIDYEADGYLSDPDSPYFTRVAVTEGGQYGGVRIYLFHSLCGTVERYARQQLL